MKTRESLIKHADDLLDKCNEDLNALNEAIDTRVNCHTQEFQALDQLRALAMHTMAAMEALVAAIKATPTDTTELTTFQSLP